jgi:uncharacterized membrane protein YgcG
MLPSEHPSHFKESDVDVMLNNPTAKPEQLKSMLYYFKGLNAGDASFKKLALMAFVFTSSMVFGGAYMANLYAKDSFVSTDSQLTGLDGNVVMVGSAERFGDLFSLPTYSVQTLAKLNEISCYVDMTSVPEVEGWAQGTFKVTSSYKKLGSSVAYFNTADSATLKIDADKKVATLAMNGKILPVSDSAPPTLGRALQEENAKPEPVLRRRRLSGRRGGGTSSESSFSLGGSSNRAGND